MADKTVLITTPWLSPGCEIEARLREAGLAVHYAPAIEAFAEPAAVDAVIAGTEPIPAASLALAERLSILVRTGVGYDNVDVAAATERGIAVCVTPGANRLSVAELVIGLIFNCAREISRNAVSVRDGRWDRRSGTEISGATLGVIGLGSIGKTVAELALGLGMRVLAFDPFLDREFLDRTGVVAAPLETVLAESDFVTLHVMLTEQSRNMIDAERLALMKPTAHLINTARGGIVDERALADALRDGRIAGAALDVLEEEPPAPGSELLRLDNLLVTAHIAGATVESRDRSARSAAEQIVGFFAGEEPVGLVDPRYASARDDSIDDVA